MGKDRFQLRHAQPGQDRGRHQDHRPQQAQGDRRLDPAGLEQGDGAADAQPQLQSGQQFFQFVANRRDTQDAQPLGRHPTARVPRARASTPQAQRPTSQGMSGSSHFDHVNVDKPVAAVGAGTDGV